MPNKAIILIGGPSKGTRFRPLSLYLPKPLFPIAGVPLIYHTIEALSKVPNMKEIILLGSFQELDKLQAFLDRCTEEFNIKIKYYKENDITGSAGGVYRYRKEILSENVDKFFVINGDILGDFRLNQIIQFHDNYCSNDQFIILGKYNDPSYSSHYGCISFDDKSKEILHFVEKPDEFSSNVISCGVYMFTPAVFAHMENILAKNDRKAQSSVANSVMNSSTNGDSGSFDMDDSESGGDSSLSGSTGNLNQSGSRLSSPLKPKKGGGRSLSFETNLFPELAGSGGHLKCFILPGKHIPWMQIKSSSSALYADQMILHLYAKNHPERLAKQNVPSGPLIKGNVYIHPTAIVDPSAVLGPNVSICARAQIGQGARISYSIICDNAIIKDHAFITWTIIGWNSSVGRWSRIEGTPLCEPCGTNNKNGDDAFDDVAHITNICQSALFTTQGKLNPSTTIIANDVDILSELVVYNAIVLPHKELKESISNQIVL